MKTPSKIRNTSNKSPYEVRLDVMQMAKDILDKEYAASGQMYSPDKVVTTADTLYSFVSDTSTDRGKK